jgi:hypothetical protein
MTTYIEKRLAKLIDHECEPSKRIVWVGIGCPPRMHIHLRLWHPAVRKIVKHRQADVCEMTSPAEWPDDIRLREMP